MKDELIGFFFLHIELATSDSATMGLHKQYMRVGQSAKNSLFGITPDPARRRKPEASPLQMLISHQGKINHSRLTWILFGIFALVLGIILSSIPWLDYIILKNLRLWNGTLSFHYWQKPGVIRLTKVYIFNITNVDNFLAHGEKPKLTEIGPFVYRENMEKVNIKFHENHTVTYQHKKILNFVPELSVNKETRLHVPNIPLLSLSTMSNNVNFIMQRAISMFLTATSYKPFVQVTADELVFGYDDILVALAHNFYPRSKRPASKMGLLISRNGTLKEVSTIYTGHTSMSDFGLLSRLNGLDKLPYWKESPCNDIRASEGSFFPPREYTKSDLVYVYDKDLCRIIPLQYRGPANKHGISADLYTPPDDVFNSTYDENKCYYNGIHGCVPRGLQYIGPCQSDAPVYLSFPHFYDADPSLLDAVEGLKPDEMKHRSYFKIQPRLGVPVEGKIRVQLNLKVERAWNIASVKNFPSMVYPIMWLEEGVDELTPEIRTWVYLATTVADLAVPILNYGMISLGAFILIVVFVKAYKNIVFTKQTIEIGMKTIRRGSTFIVNGQHRLMIVRDSYTLLNTNADNEPEV